MTNPYLEKLASFFDLNSASAYAEHQPNPNPGPDAFRGGVKRVGTGSGAASSHSKAKAIAATQRGKGSFQRAATGPGSSESLGSHLASVASHYRGTADAVESVAPQVATPTAAVTPKGGALRALAEKQSKKVIPSHSVPGKVVKKLGTSKLSLGLGLAAGVAAGSALGHKKAAALKELLRDE